MVEKKEEQTMRFSSEELNLLKNTFQEKPELLIILRKVFWQKELTMQEDELLKKVINVNVVAVLRKQFLPVLDGGLPINQELDLWMTISLVDKTPEDAHPHIMARKMMIDYIEQQLERLEYGNGKIKIFFDELDKMTAKIADCSINYINLIARNSIISHIEQQLLFTKILANAKDETPEETIKRISKDSSK